MDTPEVFIKRGQATLNWVPPGTDVGSTLIYRATDNINDNLGSRDVITTLDDDIYTYTDSTSGSRYNVYRVQFWNGTGSSPLSDPVTPFTSDNLAQINEVKTTARISANSDIGSDEVYASIKDATNWVFREYGDPIKKTAIYLDNNNTNESYTYDFTGHMGPVYQLRNITVEDIEEELVSGSSWTASYREGLIRFNNTFTTNHTGEYARVEWVPQIFNDLVKVKAALDLLETGIVMDGADSINPRITKLKRQLKEIRESIKPKGVWAPRHVLSTQFVDTSPSNVSTWADIIGQKYDRRSLRFDDD